MEKDYASAGEQGVFDAMNKLVRNQYPEMLYDRDLLLDAIDLQRLKMRAKAFSVEVMGTDGTVHLTNRDYRLMLGILSSAYERLGKRGVHPSTVLLSALEAFEERCSPGAEVFVSRIQALLDADLLPDDAPQCSPRARVRDIIRLLEESYPLGTSMTDPDGGKEAAIPVDRLVHVQSYGTGVEEQVRLSPVRSKTAVMATVQEDGSAYAARVDVETDGVGRFGRERRFKKFFKQPIGGTLVLQPDVNLGESVHPGSLIVVRHRNEIILMMKDILSYASYDESPVSNASGDVAVEVKQSQEIKSAAPLSTVNVFKRQPNGGFDPDRPDVTYEFFNNVDGEAVPSFGKTIRTERSSAQ